MVFPKKYPRIMFAAMLEQSVKSGALSPNLISSIFLPLSRENAALVEVKS